MCLLLCIAPRCEAPLRGALEAQGATRAALPRQKPQRRARAPNPDVRTSPARAPPPLFKGGRGPCRPAAALRPPPPPRRRWPATYCHPHRPPRARHLAIPSALGRGSAKPSAHLLRLGPGRAPPAILLNALNPHLNNPSPAHKGPPTVAIGYFPADPHCTLPTPARQQAAQQGGAPRAPFALVQPPRRPARPPPAAVPPARRSTTSTPRRARPRRAPLRPPPGPQPFDNLSPPPAPPRTAPDPSACPAADPDPMPHYPSPRPRPSNPTREKGPPPRPGRRPRRPGAGAQQRMRRPRPGPAHPTPWHCGCNSPTCGKHLPALPTRTRAALAPFSPQALRARPRARLKRAAPAPPAGAAPTTAKYRRPAPPLGAAAARAAAAAAPAQRRAARARLRAPRARPCHLPVHPRDGNARAYAFSRHPDTPGRPQPHPALREAALTLRAARARARPRRRAGRRRRRRRGGRGGAEPRPRRPPPPRFALDVAADARNAPPLPARGPGAPLGRTKPTCHQEKRPCFRKETLRRQGNALKGVN
jgi:hypothetical protein